MKAMTHDDFLKRLAELEPQPGHEPSSLGDLLGAEAAGHAAACEDCARTAQALLRLAVDENALFDEPPADYWLSFEERLAERLGLAEPEGSLERPAAMNRETATWTLALRVAAVLALAVGLTALTLRSSDDGAEAQRRAASSGDDPFVETLETYDDTLAAWSDWTDWTDWTAESPDEGRAFATLATDEVLPGLLHSPSDSLHDELSLELDDSQAAALARLLRAEMSS